MLITPCAGVGGVNGVQRDAMFVGLGGKPVAKHRGWDSGNRSTEPFAAAPTSHGFAASVASVGEVEVLHRDSSDVVLLGVVDESGNRMPDQGIAAIRRPRQVQVDALGLADRVAVWIEAPHGEVVGR